MARAFRSSALPPGTYFVDLTFGKKTQRTFCWIGDSRCQSKGSNPTDYTSTFGNMSGQMSNTASIILKAVPCAMFGFFVFTKANVVHRDFDSDVPLRPKATTIQERQDAQGPMWREVRRFSTVLGDTVREQIPENTRRRPEPVPDTNEFQNQEHQERLRESARSQ
jgi:hypothetical protein